MEIMRLSMAVLLLVSLYRCFAGNVGLQNVGNTCYMNALLQVLLHINPVMAVLGRHAALISGLPDEETLSDASHYNYRLLKCFLALKTAYDAATSVVRPDAFRDALVARCPDLFQTDRQEDATEGLGCLCGALIVETGLSDVIRKTYKYAFSQEIDDLLGVGFGEVKWHRYCLDDGHPSKRRRSPPDALGIQLQIKGGTLVECLQHFFAWETLLGADQWVECEACEHRFDKRTFVQEKVWKEHQRVSPTSPYTEEYDYEQGHYGIDGGHQVECRYLVRERRNKVDGGVTTRQDPVRFASERRIFIWRLPPIVVIALKRFDAKGQKISQAVTVPEQLEFIALDQAAQRYQLIGIIIQSGSARGGHYWAYAKSYPDIRPGEGTWWKFDDSRATSHGMDAQVGNICSSGLDGGATPYVLVYHRLGGDMSPLDSAEGWRIAGSDDAHPAIAPRVRDDAHPPQPPAVSDGSNAQKADQDSLVKKLEVVRKQLELLKGHVEQLRKSLLAPAA